MERFFFRIVFDNGNYEYDYEGVDDMFFYIKFLMLGISFVLSVYKGRI